jgi:hypothetical protein
MKKQIDGMTFVNPLDSLRNKAKNPSQNPATIK